MSSHPNVIEFDCPHCQTTLKSARENAGKKGRCSNCKTPVTVPEVLSEFDVIYKDTPDRDKGQGDSSKKDEHQFDIDFEFGDDIEDVIANAKEPPPDIVTPPPILHQGTKIPTDSPTRPKLVVSDENLPHKKRLKKEIAQRSASAPGKMEEQAEATPAKPPPIVLFDDAAEGSELHLQVDSTDVAETGDVGDKVPPEEDTSPIRVEGITSDQVDVADLYGMKCTICDTRIHVTQDQVGTTVDCPVCFTKVEVKPPEKPSKHRPDWMGPVPGFKAESEEGSEAEEFRLADPVERPKIDMLIKPDHGLPEVEKDLLAPLPTQADFDEAQMGEDEDISDLQLTEEEMTTRAETQRPETPQPPTPVQPAAPPVSTSDSDSQPTPVPTNPKNKVSLRERFENSLDEPEQEKPLSVHTSEELKPLTYKALTDLVTSVLQDPALILRAVIAIVLLTLGMFVFHLFEGTIGENAEPGFVGAASMLFYGSLYLFIYGAATVWLWFICSFVFRDTARGLRQVETFKTQGFDEMKSTFLLFAFSFAVAGSPFLMLSSYISAPIRFLIAPLLLIVAWFNQWPFIGVDFEPFKTFKTEPSDWKQFYIYVLGLAFASCLGGLFYHVPYCGIIGATIMVVATLAFSAITGWHSGRMIRKLDDPI